MTTKSNKIIVHTDGGAIDNPGPAAIGVVIENVDRKLLKEYAQDIGRATNNEAEYKALIFAFKKVKSLFGKEKIKKLAVEFYLDSQLLVEQLNGRYKIKEKDLQPLFLDVWNLKIDFGNASFNCVPREENKRADALVKSKLNQASLL